jgi:hypothetical protein
MVGVPAFATVSVSKVAGGKKIVPLMLPYLARVSYSTAPNDKLLLPNPQVGTLLTVVSPATKPPVLDAAMPGIDGLRCSPFASCNLLQINSQARPPPAFIDSPSAVRSSLPLGTGAYATAHKRP